MADTVGEAVVELRADMDRLRRDIRKSGKDEGDRFGNVFSKQATKRIRGIGESLKSAGVGFGTLETVAGVVGPAMIAVGSALSAATAGATALVGAIGPAAVAGATAFAGALVAVKSATLLVKFAAGDMAKALGGDTKAMAALTPAARSFAQTLKGMKPQLEGVRKVAASNLFGGLGPATQKLGRLYFPLLRTAAAETGTALNRLAKQGAAMVSTGPWRRDFATIAKDNASNIGLFGKAGLQVADAARSIFVAAQPLIHTFAQWTLGAAKAFNTMIQGARKSGALAAFFRTAATNAALLGDIIGNVSVALFNVFRIGGSGQGRSMLVNLKGITAEFRAWTSSDSGASKIGKWFDDGRANLAAMGRLLRDVTVGFAKLGSGQQLAPLVDQIRTQIVPPLMDFLHNASVAGGLQATIRAIGQMVTVLADLNQQDSGLKAFGNTLFAVGKAAQFIFENVPGAAHAMGLFFTVLGARQALSLVGLGGTVNALGASMVSLTTKTRLATGAQVAASGKLATFSQNMAHATGVMGAEAAGLAATTTRFASLKAGARQAAGPAGILLLLAASQSSNKALRTLGSVAGGVAAGFSVGGVWGAAIGGVVGLLASFRRQTGLSAKAQQALRDSSAQVASTLDRETGAITRATRAAANKALADNGVYDAARKLNIPLNQVLRAYLGNGKAAAAVGRIIQHLTNGVLPKHIASTQKQREAQQRAAAAMRAMTPAIEKVNGAIIGNNGALAKQRRRLQEQREAAAGSTSGAHKLAAGFHDAQDHASTMGDAASRAAAQIKKIPEKRSTHISAPGLDQAREKLSPYLSMLFRIPPTRHTEVSTHYSYSGSRGPTPGKPLPNATGNAGGTSHWRGGWSWVGEGGPELLRLPAGAQVMPHRQSVDFANKGGSGKDVTFNVYPPTDDVEATSSQIMNRLVLAGAFG